MRKPKDLLLASGQRAIISMDEVILLFEHRKLNEKTAKKLSKWLLDASLYLKSKKESKTRTTGPGFIV